MEVVGSSPQPRRDHVRLLPRLASEPPAVAPGFAPVCGGAVAWWHAYEARGRGGGVAAGVVAVGTFAWLLNLTQRPETYGLRYGPPPDGCGSSVTLAREACPPTTNRV